MVIAFLAAAAFCRSSCALLMAVQFLLPTLTCYEKSGNFPRKTSALLSLLPSLNQEHPLDVKVS